MKGAIRGDCETVSRLLLADGTLVNFRDFVTGYSALHWSCTLSRLDLVSVLLFFRGHTTHIDLPRLLVVGSKGMFG